MIKRLFVSFGVLMLMLSLSGCLMNPGASLKAVNFDLKVQTGNLLKKYGLHPKGEAIERMFKLQGNFELVNESSKEIGLDLSGYEGKEIKTLIYTLQETSQYDSGKVNAYILYDKAIIGAYLVLEGYVPGVVSLNDRSCFMPESLKAHDLQFKGVNKVEIKGPWEQNRWKYEVTLFKVNEISSILALVDKSISVPQDQEYLPVPSVAKYIITFYYDEGAVVRGQLYVGQDFTKLTLDPFPKWSYDPPNELKIYIEQALR